MPDYSFAPPVQPDLPITGSELRYPVRRIFCVGRNYADHVAEMGGDAGRDAPIYFTKSAHTLLQSGQDMPYPPGTDDLHHEIELVVAIGGTATAIDRADAASVIWGYGVGLDMTRRDLQNVAKDAGQPWDTSKDFDAAAIIAALTPADQVQLSDASIRLAVNDTTRQESPLASMVWSVPDIVANLSTLYTLYPGDLIMTGTPAGVSAVVRGDVLVGTVDGLDPVQTRIV
ncbi:fumarylacetoacetate hydrolase family protein [Loktanella sp. SALINAS62]|uniref:fumarylacetoacetate hydrolase family protein n=1 Tax=Loktanella sp. SALINAS62 TaxID=2706124 RepID=UPI001B8B82E2|nr:fumarylacetoacetate hydrolase family protein [Loktanella sp. SALINAS62]MBS1304257.1 fumarylacetoacetate hydrolase family protein [Loktanella sp. SALINAS62]